ncbi:hypothetical protein CDCA_CDCA05G1453 [Cyanidium caldarium]|uniref:DNA replication licensing factor MCM4 n=1 Tax=Cyanidium caldarium TaxID=2771 RepID=A0AAV9IU99_CYACA|nr:hypothetical protein CDCA_CDCA05G1453 [Cyanidium caldarium]
MPTSPGHGGGSASDASQLRLSSVPLSGTEAWALSSAGPSGRRPAAVTPHGTSSAVVSATPARLSSGRRELGEAPFGARAPAAAASAASLTPRVLHMPSESELSVIAGGARGPSSDEGAAPTRVLWGTDLSVDEVHARLLAFLREYRDTEDTTVALYTRALYRLHETESYTLNVDLQHLRAHDADLYKKAVRYPSDVINLFDLAVNNLYTEMFPGTAADERPQRLLVRVYHLGACHSLRTLEPAQLDQLASLQGMVIRSSHVIPDLVDAFYRCVHCQHTTHVPVEHGRIQEPPSCARCGLKSAYQLVHNRCGFSDKQVVRLQEAPEHVPQGETPASITLVTYEDMVDAVKPGDRIEVTGIYRAAPIRLNPRMRNVRSVYRTYLDVVHIKHSDRRRLTDVPDATDVDALPPAETAEAPAASSSAATEYANPPESNPLPELTASMQAHIRQLAAQPHIYERLVASLAPSIWGMEDVKRGVLLQLFGGTKKDFSEAGGTRFRSEINVLLVGDPGVSKSQLLGYVHRIAPRGIYTSGRGSSAVGLTAYVTRDPDTREMVLESGALVLSDRGICCIDEFDKMSEQSRTIMHEAMEQQTISIAKAGIIATLNARTAVLAAANPVESRYNPRLSVIDNIQMPPTLLSRFDLIYLVLDKPSADEDRRLARHIVSLFYDREDGHDSDANDAVVVGGSDESLPLMDLPTLAAYISYAREHVHPRLSAAASERLISGYLDMRRLGSAGASFGGQKTITATPRQLEALVRLSEAHAKARLSETVELADVDEALRLMRVATQQAATDPVTGTIDMDLLATGRSAASRARITELARSVWELLQARDGLGPFRKHALLHELRQQAAAAAAGSGSGDTSDISEQDFDDALRRLQDEERVRLQAGGSSIVKVRG